MSKCTKCGQQVADETEAFHIVTKHGERALLALLVSNDALLTELIIECFGEPALQEPPPPE